MDETVTASVPATEEPKKTNKERLKEITDNIEAGIKDLFDSEKYKNYLRTMSKFHNYSFNNTMLIHIQNPEATSVAGKSKWLQKFNREVKDSEIKNGIQIIAPAPYIKKVEEMKLDPETQAPMVDQNGKVIMEEKQIKIMRYRVATVYDVSQTVGDPLPHLASDLTGDVQQFDIFMEALKRSAPVPMEMQPLAENLDGYFSPSEQRIVLRDGMSEVQTICAAVHEIAHSKLHNKLILSDVEYQQGKLFDRPILFTKSKVDKSKLPMGLNGYDLRGLPHDRTTPALLENKVLSNFVGTVITNMNVTIPDSGVVDIQDKLTLSDERSTLQEYYEAVLPEMANKSQHTQEVEAESIAFSVCAYYGIETGENSFGYIASWSSDKNLKELKASLETINRTAGGLINDIDANFETICKERGIDIAPKETVPLAHEALFRINDDIYLHVQRRSEDHDYDYSLYDGDTLKFIDGGVTELPEDSTLIDAPLIVAAQEILTDCGIDYDTIDPVSLNKLQEIRSANEIVPPAEIMPEEPVRGLGKLDEYPMPSSELGTDVFVSMGYNQGDILPVTREEAHSLMDQDFSVFFVSYSLEPEMCLDHQDIDNIPELSDPGFGILRDEWEASDLFKEKIAERLDHQPEREASFLAHPDSFAIYQINDHSSEMRFMNYEQITERGVSPARNMYDLVYTAELNGQSLDNIYDAFDVARPPDYRSPSPSVSDIIALNQGSEVTYHYVDSCGFRELPDFAADNPLKNAEMSMEDDYNMVDGIINNGEKRPTVTDLEERSKSEPISLMDLHEAIRREQRTPDKKPEVMEKRPSVLAMLQQPIPSQDSHKKTAPHKSTEMEI